MSTSLQPPHEQSPAGTAVPGPTRSTGSAEPTGPHPLDNSVWAALTGPHRHLAERVGSAARYRTDVSPFVAIADPEDPRSWTDLAALVGPGNYFALAGPKAPPEGWSVGEPIQGMQMVGTSLRDGPDPEAVRLTPADVPEMLDLVDRTKPGPFLPRTIELGAYYGIRRDGRLIAMAGERLHPPGWTEISAVCTDPDFRGEGLATRLILAVAHGIRERGETPFLHTAASNTNAIRLYESLGFRLRRNTLFSAARVPEHADA